MPGQAPALTDERALLLAYIDQQRDGIRNAAYGLTEEQAWLSPSVSALGIGGLVKHVTAMEQSWMATVLQRERPGTDEMEDSYGEEFRRAEGETLAGVLARLDQVA